MSQQTNAGFNAPGFSVVADDPAGASPGTAAVTAAKSGPCERAASRIAPSVERTPLSASDAVGVGQQATCACIRRSVRLTPQAPFSAALRAKKASGDPPGWATVGVAHSAANACARIDTSPAELPASLLPFFAGAKLVGVAHSAAATCLGN
jgi:hypothetical protein